MANLEIGTQIGKYVLTQFIGRGGMGEVWQARHSRLANRIVAIKVLLPEHQLLGDSAARFMREAEVLADLGEHPHIVNILDFDQHDGRDCIVMTYLPGSLAHTLGETEQTDGDTLGASVQNMQSLAIEEALQITRQICDGLAFAHAHDVIHRDLKPANVLLTAEGTVQLCDFGIAHVASSTGLTGTGIGMGTLGYTAMEILEGRARDATPQSDLYSVGAILYRMVTGRAPLGRFRDPAEHNPDVPHWLNTCILNCLEEDPTQRYESADALRDALNSETNITLGSSIPADLRDLWDAHEARLKDMGFSIPQDQDLVIRNEKDDGIALWIPSGEFMMGGEKYDDEKPIHRVVLDGYYMDLYPVTVGQYQKYVSETGGDMPFAPSWGWQSHHPIVNVSWEDAVAYCTWADKQLPTEAQWEYAARGADSREYPWGNDESTPRLANYNSQIDKTTPVGSYPSSASAFGLLDMAGNVHEWCEDWFDESFYASSPEKNPKNDKPSGYKCLRGGSWFGLSDFVRCAARFGVNPGDRDDSIGFRVARQKKQ